LTNEEEISRANEARMILSNTLFKEAVEAVQEALLSGIKRSPLKEADLREKLCQQMIALDAVVGQLQTHMETGKLAEETIKRRGASRQPL
jgi:type II secretory pathway component PulF